MSKGRSFSLFLGVSGSFLLTELALFGFAFVATGRILRRAKIL
jgi:hypothetical protein